MTHSEDSAQVIFVLVDGMRDDVARVNMGYLEGLVEEGFALRAQAQSILPSLSRPCYEAIMTGCGPTRNGITSNEIVRKSHMTSVFDVIRDAGKQSAVVGYHWMSELFHRAPFDRIADVEQNDNPHSYHHGRFYYLDTYPDVHVFSQAEWLRQSKRPDFLVIHPMGVDDAGHKFGSDSKEYHDAVATIDMILGVVMPMWLADGATVIVTADHGMNAYGFHGGTEPGVRTVPFYLAGHGVTGQGVHSEVLDQTTLADFLCRLIGTSRASSMNAFPEDVFRRWVSSVQTMA